MPIKNNVYLLIIPPGTVAALFLFILLLLGYARFRTPSEQPVLYIGIPLQGSTVIIDPSHGGIDSGSHYQERILEKDISLAVALELNHYLQQAGAKVILTRSTDEDVSRHITDSSMTRYHRDLQGRRKLINESGGDLFISLHVDACADPSIRGAITFYNSSNLDNKCLAECVQQNLNPVVRANPGAGDYFHQNIREGDYYLLNEARIPGVIVEMGFMTSPADRALLIQPNYQKKLAEALFMGLVEYYFSKPPPANKADNENNPEEPPG